MVPFFGQLKTEDWMSVGAEIRTWVERAKSFHVSVCSEMKKCSPYSYRMCLMSCFESSSSCTGTPEVGKQKWLL